MSSTSPSSSDARPTLPAQPPEVGLLKDRAESGERALRNRHSRALVLIEQRQQRLGKPCEIPKRDQRLVAIGVAAQGSIELNTVAGS
jgi:hypothetical protein